MNHRGDQNVTASRAWKLAYFGSTGLTAIAFLTLGGANLAHADPIMQGLSHLGYPPYLASVLGAWYVLAVFALLTPGLKRAKEWAYAGLFFALTGAAVSHGFNYDAPAKVLVPLVLLGAVMTSRVCLTRLQPRAG